MRYYLIQTDNNYIKIPRFKDLHRHLDVRDITMGGYYKIPKRMLFRIEEDRDTMFVDILATPIFLLTEKIKKLLSMFEPNLNFKEFILLDQGHGRTETYYMPTLEEIDCLSEKSEFSRMHSELARIVLDREKIQDKAIFTIAGVDRRYVIARLDVIESMIRRDATGYRITELEVE
ncbi:MAG TPA: hypothetical protein VHQ24_01540 [Lachnospiraceae bacterium]|nr:hypothetical protein [Lachnospiraceae bacterium]